MTIIGEKGKNFSREIGRQVCETVFGGQSSITRCTFFGEILTGNLVSDGNEGKWEVVIEAGLGLTGARSREDIQVFSTRQEAETFADANSHYWNHRQFGSRLNKGSRI